MSNPTYAVREDPGDERPLVWLAGEIRTPPFSRAGRLLAGYLLRRLQRGDRLAMPFSRPMPVIGRRCRELRVRDGDRNWRICYRTDPDAVVILAVFPKTSRETPLDVIESCRRRLREYDDA